MSESLLASQCQEALISVRLVVVDHYQVSPYPGLDPLVSQFTGYNIKKVPIIRIFGSSPAGQRVCLHLHGVFPYFYVPLPPNEDEGFIYRLAASLNKAINLSLNQAQAKIEHVYKAVKVTGIPMYGYHAKQHTFIKIYLYNPYMVKRASDLLQHGAVMNQVLQPHESHTNLVLQFFMDYNLQGMNEIHLAYGKFREGVLTDELDEVESILSPPWQENRPARTVVDRHQSEDDPAAVISSLISVPPDQRYFYVEDLPPSLKTPSDLVRQATTELEMDAVAADILNQQDLTGEAMNPGLVSLWTDERLRREAAGLTDPLTPPSSPPRDQAAGERSESEKFWHERLCQAIQEKKLSTEPRDYQDPDDPDATINMERKLRPQVYPVETSQRDLQSLPDATLLEPHILSLSESLNTTADLSINESQLQQQYSDETIVDEQFILTQLQDTEDISLQGGSVDEELLDLLDDLAYDANNKEGPGGEAEKEKEEEEDMFKTPLSAKSQRSLRRSQGSSSKKRSKSVSQVLDLEEGKEEEEEDLETLEMSQAIWSSESNWADEDQTLLEDLVRTLDYENEETTCDIEDLVK